MGARHTTLVLLTLALAATGRAQDEPTALFVASERLTALALEHPHFPGFDRLGFGTAAEPWHPWFGAEEMRALVHLPGRAPPGVDVGAEAFLGNGFQGRPWASGFAALASFDADRNGIVEGPEMEDLHLVSTRDGPLLRARDAYAGFDLRVGVREVGGHARAGRLSAFAGLRRRDYRSHLVELTIQGHFPSRDRALLSHASLPAGAPLDRAHALSGEWRWTPDDAAEWQDETKPWAGEPGGSLLLAVTGTRIRGVVQYVGAHRDRIHLPLEGVLREDGAEWTSVSPLGLTRSTVRLESGLGHPVLRGSAFGNRNGRVREWTWSATYERPIE